MKTRHARLLDLLLLCLPSVTVFTSVAAYRMLAG